MIGCLNCDVGTFLGLIDGLNEIVCHSAKRGLDDNFNYSSSYAHLKEGEKYPEWCPLKEEIEKEENKKYKIMWEEMSKIFGNYTVYYAGKRQENINYIMKQIEQKNN